MLIDFLITGDGSAYSLLSEDQIWGTITKALDSVMYSINTAIYKIIIALYEIFEILSKARLLNSEEFMEIASRIGAVLGIVMLFNVIFNFINMLLDPNKLEDKEKGALSIIKRCLLVIVMLGVSSYFFDITWDFQNYIIEQGVLYKLMMPADKDLDTDKFGAVLAARTFTGFYHVEKKLINDGSVQDCVYYDGLLLKGIAENQDFSPGRYCLGAYTQKADEKGKMVDYFIMDYNFLMQTFVGGILVYLLVSYVIKVGVRVIQLTVLQIISPMAIISYLSPKKDNMFSKWWKIYFATYIDIFIRCAIIYLVVYLSSSLLDSLSKSLTDMNSTFNQSISADLAASTNPEKIIIYITIAMIIALLMFAKKAPELLKELFPAGASKLGLGGIGFKDMLGGGLMQKGYDKAKGMTKKAAKAIGLMPVTTGKKIISGIDSASNGKGFLNGYRRHQGAVGQWINKQRETLTPESYKKYQERREGRENVSEISTKWEKGAGIALNLKKKRGFSGDDWKKALDGSTRANYDAIFKNKEFINSKMNVDHTSKIEEQLRYAQQAIHADPTQTIIVDGVSYNNRNILDLEETLDKTQKKLKGLEEVHAEISKQYQNDAETEKYFKFIKNNDTNPANPTSTHRSKGLT